MAVKWIITGMNGTVAPALAEALERRGDDVIAWDRSSVPTDDESIAQSFIEHIAPDGICHLAMGAPSWAASMARQCHEGDIPFLFTSTVSVFGPDQHFPLTTDIEPHADDDYGTYKRECERRVREASPAAIIARLGWQIGFAPGSNTMVNHLHERAAEGPILANTAWRPSCSFLPDTAGALVGLLDHGEPGLFHVEGNPGLSFHEIAVGLNRVLDLGWQVEADDADPFDNRMVDQRVPVPPISDRLD